MGHHDRGYPEPALQILDLVTQMHPHLGIQGRQGLVQEKQARRDGDGAGERNALLLTTGELSGILVTLLRQSHQLQQFVHALADICLGSLTVLQAVGDVLRHRHVGKQGVGLKDNAEVPFRGRQRGNVLAGLLDLAGGLDVEAGDGAQQGGLSAAGGPEKAHELALVDLQGNVLQRRERPEHLGQPRDA